MVEVLSQMPPHRDGAFGKRCFSMPLRTEVLDAEKPSSSSPPPSPSPSPARRHVNFQEQCTVITQEYDFCQCCDNDYFRKWYTAYEMEHIRNEAKATSIGLRRRRKRGTGGEDERSEQELKDSLCREVDKNSADNVPEVDEGSVDNVTLAFRKTTLVLRSDFKALIKLGTSTPDQDLALWCGQDDGRRGLERFASRDYGNHRRKDVQTVRTLVVMEHARQRQLGIKDGEEQLAQLSREATRRARTFALFVGEADALTAGTKRPAPPIRSCPPRKRSKTIQRSAVEPKG